MNRIELAAANSTVEPLSFQSTAPVATVALVGVGVAAAALGWQVGYHLGGALEDGEQLLDTTLEDAVTSDDLVSVRRAAIAA